MKMTFNRQLILSVLSEEIDSSPPPHSAGTISYHLETAFNYKWNVEPYSLMKTLPNMRQIHRTLKELWQGGFIVGTRVKIDGYSGQLPYWQIEYQLSGEVYRNSLIDDCNAIYRKIDKAKNGSRFFSSVFDMGLPASEVKPLMLKVKGLMQKTHPDKANGYQNQFKQMMECAAWIRSGIPLPTPTHEVGEKVTLKLTYP